MQEIGVRGALSFGWSAKGQNCAIASAQDGRNWGASTPEAFLRQFGRPVAVTTSGGRGYEKVAMCGNPIRGAVG